MITKELILWLLVVFGILGFGMGSMLWAYRRPWGARPLFVDPLTELSVPLGDRSRTQFQKGCEAFHQGRYAQALGQFTSVMEAEPACAEALYNYGLACANLGNDGLAVSALVKASDLYAAQGSPAGLDRVKQALEQLAARPSQSTAAEQSRG